MSKYRIGIAGEDLNAGDMLLVDDETGRIIKAYSDYLKSADDMNEALERFIENGAIWVEGSEKLINR